MLIPPFAPNGPCIAMLRCVTRTPWPEKFRLTQDGIIGFFCPKKNLDWEDRAESVSVCGFSVI